MPNRWPKMLACLSYAENIVECYDFESGKWILLTERPVDVPHYGSEAVTACGSKFYAVGGLQSRSTQPLMKRNFNFKTPVVFRRDVDCYDPEANTWSPCPPLRNHRVAHCVVNCPRGSGPGGSSRKSTVFVVGGSAKSEADTFCSEGLRTVETKHFSSNLSENGIDAFEWKVRNNN